PSFVQPTMSHYSQPSRPRRENAALSHFPSQPDEPIDVTNTESSRHRPGRSADHHSQSTTQSAFSVSAPELPPALPGTHHTNRDLQSYPPSRHATPIPRQTDD